MNPNSDQTIPAFSQKNSNGKPLFVTVIHAEEYWINRARMNIADYITYKTDGEKPPAKHHILWLYEMLNANKTNLIAPRGSAKTEICLNFMEWLIGKYPHRTNYIGSVTFQQATLRLQEIRSTIEFNPRYHNVFPWIKIDSRRENSQKAFTIWSERWLNNPNPITYQYWRTMISKFGESKDATLFCSGMTAKGVVGRRFSGMVLIDDPHDATNSGTDEQCVKVEDFVKKTLMPCMVKQSQINIIHTRWRINDLAGRLKEDKRANGDPIWKTIELKAVNDAGESYWPELYPLERLDAIKEEVGTIIYELMYMNNPDAATSQQFTLDMLRRPLPEPLPTFKELIISIDLAYSIDKKADFTVYTAIARDSEDRFNAYVLDIQRGKWNRSKDKIRELLKFADSISDRYGEIDYLLFHHVGGEPQFAGDLQYNETEELEQGLRDIRYPVRTIKTTGGKEERLKGRQLEDSLALKIQQGKVFFNTNMKYYDAMVSELLSFPAGHDDIVDTLILPFQQKSWSFRKTGAGIVRAKPKIRL